MQRACRTSAGADSFFTVQKLFCIEGTFLTQKTLDDDPPVLIDVFLSPRLPPTHNRHHHHRHHRRKPPLPHDNSGNSTNSDYPDGSGLDLLVQETEPTELDDERNTGSGTDNRQNGKNSYNDSRRNSRNDSRRNSRNYDKEKEKEKEKDKDKEKGRERVVSLSRDSSGNANYGEYSSSQNAADLSSLYTSDDQPQSFDLCARIQVSNCFAIFDVESIDEITGIESQDPKPWLIIESVVIDETNFYEGKHWRKLHLIVSHPETGITWTSNDSSSSLHQALRSNSSSLSSTSFINQLPGGRRILSDLSAFSSSLLHLTSNTQTRPISLSRNTEDDTLTTSYSSVLANRGGANSEQNSEHSSASSVSGNEISGSGGERKSIHQRHLKIFGW
jgi:hypothetical protein